MSLRAKTVIVCIALIALFAGTDKARAERTWSSPGWYIYGKTLNIILDLRTMTDGPFGTEPECRSAISYYSPTNYIYAYDCEYFTEDPDLDPVTDYDRAMNRQSEKPEDQYIDPSR